MKKAQQIGFEKVIAVIIVVIFLALVIMYIVSPGGPKNMIDGVINFLNSSSTEVMNK